MTLTLELTPEAEARLVEAARQRGIAPVEFARWLLEENLHESPMTGAEALEYWERQGVRGVYADRADSPELARELRREEEARGRKP